MNYGKSQLGVHGDGTIFYKDTKGAICDVTHGEGPKGDGCAEYLMLTEGGCDFPSLEDQRTKFGTNF